MFKKRRHAGTRDRLPGLRVRVSAATATAIPVLVTAVPAPVIAVPAAVTAGKKSSIEAAKADPRPLSHFPSNQAVNTAPAQKQLPDFADGLKKLEQIPLDGLTTANPTLSTPSAGLSTVPGASDAQQSKVSRATEVTQVPNIARIASEMAEPKMSIFSMRKPKVKPETDARSDQGQPVGVKEPPAPKQETKQTVIEDDDDDDDDEDVSLSQFEPRVMSNILQPVVRPGRTRHTLPGLTASSSPSANPFPFTTGVPSQSGPAQKTANVMPAAAASTLAASNMSGPRHEPNQTVHQEPASIHASMTQEERKKKERADKAEQLKSEYERQQQKTAADKAAKEKEEKKRAAELRQTQEAAKQQRDSQQSISSSAPITGAVRQESNQPAAK